MASNFVNTHPQFTVLTNGSFAPASDGEIEFFTVGNTGAGNRKDTYNIPNPSTPADPSEINPNPVPLDGYGRSTVPIFLVGGYNTVIRDSEGNQIDTSDNVSGFGGAGVSSITVNNVTELAALDTDVYQAAYVLATTTAADGGQGWFYYASGSVLTDNGVSVIEPDVGAGRWLKQNNATHSNYIASAGGTADALTLTTAPTTGVTLDPLRLFTVENTAGFNTTTTPTLTINALTVKTIKRGTSTAVNIGDLGPIGYKMIFSVLADASAIILLNPYSAPNAMGLEWKTGLLVSNNVADATNDIDIAVGSIMDTNNAYRMNLTSAFTKRIDATFAVGTGLGGMSDDDSLANDTWYGIWLLSKTTNTSDCDVIFATTKAKSLSDAVATAAGFNISRLIGYVRRGTATNLAFVDNGDDWYLWKVMIDAGISASSSAVSSTVRVPPFVLGRFSYNIFSSKAASFVSISGLISSLSQTDSAPTQTQNSVYSYVQGGGLASVSTAGSCIEDIKVSSASQIRHREDSDTTVANLMTIGWRFLPTVTDLV